MKKGLFGFLGMMGLLGLLSPLSGQQGANVVISQGPPVVPYQKLLFYSSNNLTYTCTALSTGSTQTLSVSAATRANPGVFTSTGHGFSLNSRPRIRFTTAPTGWTSILTNWILSPVDANTFQILDITTGTALDTSAFGSSFSGSANFTTQAPRTNQPVWSMQWLQYDGSNNLIAVMNAYAGSSVTNNKCDDRASAFVEWK